MLETRTAAVKVHNAIVVSKHNHDAIRTTPAQKAKRSLAFDINGTSHRSTQNKPAQARLKLNDQYWMLRLH